MSVLQKTSAEILQNYRMNVSQLKKLTHLNVFINKTLQQAEHAVNEASKRREQGQSLSDVDGMTFVVKDNLCTDNIPTSCASFFLSEFVPSYNSTAVHRLLSSGAVLLGKTNMDEFGMGSSNLHSYFGPVHHPLSYTSESDQDWLVCGGSSGGSAVAVATGMCDFALGSDTGGSVRLPAAFCGIVGVKPTYGRVSRYGLIPLASSMDTIGILAPSVTTAATVLDLISGPDDKDSTSINTPYCPCKNLDLLDCGPKDVLTNVIVGVPKDCQIPQLSTESRLLWLSIADKLTSLGANVQDVTLPHFQYSVPCYDILCATEVASNMAKYSGALFGYCSNVGAAESVDKFFGINRRDGLGDVVQHRIIAGTYFLSYHGRHHYDKALQVRRLIYNDFKTLFDKDDKTSVDIVLTPVSLGPAPSHYVMEELGPIASCIHDTYTVPVNLVGLPAVTIPVGKSEHGLPLGVQLIARWLDEATMMKVARALELTVTPDVK